MPLAEIVYIGLGANLGDARAQLRRAVDDLIGLEPTLGLRRVGVSSLYRSVPWQTEGPDFLNAVVALQALQVQDTQAPWRLLKALQDIEQQHGRTRPYRYAPRTLDLDILLFGQRCIDAPELQLPHPRALQRAFVRVPLQELAPGLQWPGGSPQIFSQTLAMTDTPDVPPPVRLDDPEWPGHARVDAGV